ncbi:MAG: hypothetical protein AAB680_04860 [Pseudomonadota bacterium]
MKLATKIGALILSVATFGTAFAGDETGNWRRPNGDTVAVSVRGGGLYCTITAGRRVGFEMCHGMRNSAADVWQGRTMKHPSMPGFMTFNGTVTISGNNLEIKGCAIGQGMCDKEKWTKLN